MSNTITSLYDLTDYQKEYPQKSTPEHMISVLFITAFFTYIIYKLYMYQYLTNDKTDRTIHTLEQHVEAAETNIIEHGFRLGDISQDAADLKEVVNQLREDVNMMAFVFRHMDMKARRTSPIVPDIESLSLYISTREGTHVGGPLYEKYNELCKEVTK